MKPLVVALLLVLVAACFYPFGQTTHVYQSVVSANHTHTVRGRASEDFLLEHGALHLRVRTTRPAPFLTWVDRVEWTAEKLADLRAQRPELEPHWPDPSRVDLGVVWLEDR